MITFIWTKLKKTVNGVKTDYAGNYIYETEVKRGSRTPFNKHKKREQNGALQFFTTPEGYAEPVSAGSTNFVYVFQYKDHPSTALRAGLGNIRLSYADADGNGIITQTEIREENNYYPFGLK
ncbi:MAG: hypothetical protein U1C58_10730, partial [Flavobacteriaceae bacterium]|nr:hypothetical protein [Flavobacteriaceae bacterium]